MIRLNVFIQVRSSEEKESIKNLALELVDKSINDEGCLDYDLYCSETEDNHFMIIETWKSREDLEKHKATAHFRRLVPELERRATMLTTVFDF